MDSEELKLTEEKMNFSSVANLPADGWPLGEHYVVVEYEDESERPETFSDLYESYVQGLKDEQMHLIDKEKAIFESLGQEYKYIYFRYQAYEDEEAEELFEVIFYEIEKAPGISYVIFYHAPVDQFDEYFEDFNSIIESFEILE